VYYPKSNRISKKYLGVGSGLGIPKPILKPKCWSLDLGLLSWRLVQPNLFWELGECWRNSTETKLKFSDQTFFVHFWN